MLLSLYMLASAAVSPTPLEQALKAPTDGPVYAYTLSYADRKIEAAGRVDPSKPRGERVKLSNAPEEPWSKKFAKAVRRIDKNAEKNLWCSQTAKYIPTDAAIQSETNDTITYSFKPLPDPDDEDSEKLMKGVVGTVVIAKENPAILEVSLTAPKPFKPMFIAKVETFDTKVKCARAPDGRTYASEWTIHVKGTALMKGLEEKTIRKITALEKVAD